MTFIHPAVSSGSVNPGTEELRDNFQRPPAECTPAYFWFINEKMDLELLLRQLHDMHDHGARCVCLHPLPPEFRPDIMPSRMSPPYLSPEFFKIIAALVEECRRLGMVYYLYDEGGWPSGGACGQVMRKRPDLVCRALEPDALGHAVEVEMPYDAAKAAPYPDVLNRETIDEFLRMTHEQYRASVGRHFGETIRFVFCDEPHFTASFFDRLTWTRGFAQEFRRRKGYDVGPYLDRMLVPATPFEPEEMVRVRIDFHEVCTRLFVDNFLLPYRDWCRAHGLLFGGHFSGEDEPRNSWRTGYGSIMKVLRAMDLPGVDVIWRQLYPGLREHPFPKYASSVANQNGRQFALSESFGVYGNGVTPELMRWMVDYMFVHGVNLEVFGVYTQAKARNWIMGERPHFGPENPEWKHMGDLHEYVGRVSYLLSRGKALHPTAQVFDIRTLWANDKDANVVNLWHEKTARQLFSRQCGFDFIDEDVLAEARVSGTQLLAGAMVYRELVVQDLRRLSPEAEAKIAEFKAAGGRVLSSAREATPLLRVVPETPQLRVEARQLIDGRTIWFFFNDGREEIEPRLFLPGAKKTAWADPETGRIWRVPAERGAIAWRFPGYGTALFITGLEADEALPQETVHRFHQVLAGSWTLKPLVRHVVGEERLEWHPDASSAMTVELGDWRRWLPSDFSGDAVYTREFAWDVQPKGGVRLDLGRVNYSCRVTLNGDEVGRRMWGPFRFDLTERLKPGKNVLQVVVTNTLANAYAPDAVDERVSRDFAPRIVYEDRQRAFEQDSLASGLFGPVTLEYDL